jgi:hypothetical protein
VAKARVRNIKFSGYIQRQWQRPLVRNRETDKVFKIYTVRHAGIQEFPNLNLRSKGGTYNEE